LVFLGVVFGVLDTLKGYDHCEVRSASRRIIEDVCVIHAGLHSQCWSTDDYLYGFCSALAREENCRSKLSTQIVRSVWSMPFQRQAFSPRGIIVPAIFLVKYSASDGITCGCSGIRVDSVRNFHIQWTTAFSFSIVHFCSYIISCSGKKPFTRRINIDKNKRDGIPDPGCVFSQMVTRMSMPSLCIRSR